MVASVRPSVHAERSAPPASSPAIAALTGLRGYAALWVLVSHILYTDSFSTPLGLRAAWAPATGLVQHEYLAVDLFFVLSGFVLTHVHARDFDRGFGHASYGRFLLLRLARVYPLHLIALVAAMLVEQVSPNGLQSTLGGFILHLLLMASWGFCATLSWNAPAWSLSSEWLAYLVLPLMILVSAGFRRLRTQLLALTVVTALFGFFFFGFLLSPQFIFPIDLGNGTGANARVLSGVAIGCVLRRLYDQPSVRKLPWTALFWLSLPLVARAMSDLDGRRLDNNLWAYIGVVFVVFAAACASPRKLLPLTTRVPMYLGEISYAIYIFHFPVVRALGWFGRKWLDRVATRGSVLDARLTVLGAVVVVIVVAMVANRFVEKPLRERLRRWIDARYPAEPRRAFVEAAPVGDRPVLAPDKVA